MVMRSSRAVQSIILNKYSPKWWQVVGVDKDLETNNTQKRQHSQHISLQTVSKHARPRQCKTRQEAKTPSAQERANTLPAHSQIPNTGIVMSTVYSGMPTRPGHVTLSISFVALIVAVMSTQYCSSAPGLGQPINGATHTAGNREMGLKVSHDQDRGIVNRFSFAYCGRPSLPQEAGSAA
jgi:hypothetical protein